MELIKLSSVTANPTELSQGESVNGYKAVTWVERYREPGEFKIEAKLSSGLKTFLPIDTFITHKDTSVVMRVENHEIDSPEDEDPTIEITGRCFTSYLENRIVGDPQAYLTNAIGDWVMASDQTWDQIVTMIDEHLISSIDADASIIGVDVNHTCSGSVTTAERLIRPIDVLQAVQEILKIDDLGIKSVRPTSSDPLTYFTVYRGNNVSTRVRFSAMRGDLSDIRYLFSDKKMKTVVRMMGRWVQVVWNPSGSDNYARRTIVSDASYIDERQTAMPAGGALALIIAAMQIRADEILKKQSMISITQADISPNAKFRYRVDYNLGDLVTVDGEFDSSGIFRVIEFAETEDEDGTSAHPTLAIPGEY